MTWNYPNEPELDGSVDLKFVLERAHESISQDEYGMTIAMLFGRDDLPDEIVEHVKDMHRYRDKFLNADLDSSVSPRAYNEMCDIGLDLRASISRKLRGMISGE